MAYRDLRQFLDLLEKDGQLCRVSAEVDPKYEIGAVCDRSFNDFGQDKNPALLFEKVKGFSNPVAVSVLASPSRVAAAIGCGEKDFHREWIRRSASGIEPVIVKDGPCKENIITGDAVNLYDLPVPTWNGRDGGPFITFACQISKDPETGIRNVAMYRSQVFDRQRLGIFAAPFRHLNIQFSRAHARKQAFPVALAIGLDPAIPLAAVAPFPFGADELALAGSLRGAPVELVRCETIPLEAPAHSEWVLEGEIEPDTKLREGPFGEALGYYGEAQPREVIRVRAITHRNNAIYQGSHVRKPPNEQSTLFSVVEAEVVRQCPLPGLLDFHLTVGGGKILTGVASIRKSYEAHARTMAMGILGSSAGQKIKTIIVVDDDIDIRNETDVQWAVATRCDYQRGIQLLDNLQGNPLDPSMPEESRVSGSNLMSKMIVDATRPLKGVFPTVIQPDPETARNVAQRWQEYGICPIAGDGKHE